LNRDVQPSPLLQRRTKVTDTLLHSEVSDSGRTLEISKRQTGTFCKDSETRGNSIIETQNTPATTTLAPQLRAGSSSLYRDKE
jgi:hypothetical protein